MATVAVQGSIDFDVAMHDHHEGAEYRISASIRSARIGDQVVAVVHVPHGSAARFVRPVAVAALAIPVKIYARPDDERREVAFFRTLVVCGRSGNHIVSDRSGANCGATQGCVHCTVGAAWLRECVGPIVRGIVVAIVVELFLSSVVPPQRLVKRSAMATFPGRPGMRTVPVMFTNAQQAVHFPFQDGGETTNFLDAGGELPDKTRFKIGIYDLVEKFFTVNRTGGHSKGFRPAASDGSDLLNDKPTIAKDVFGRGKVVSSETFRWFHLVQNFARLLTLDLDDRIGPSAKNVDRYAQ